MNNNTKTFAPQFNIINPTPMQAEFQADGSFTRLVKVNGYGPTGYGLTMESIHEHVTGGAIVVNSVRHVEYDYAVVNYTVV